MFKQLFAVVTLAIISCSISALANEKVAKTKCGESNFEIRAELIPGSKIQALSKIIVSAKSETESIRLVFDNIIDSPWGGEYFFATCLQGKDKRSYIVFQNYCSGSACRDLDNFGIIDAQSLRVLLVPSDNNHSIADQIIGYSVPPLFDNKDRFF